ncbi:MAG: hypothetical protein LBE09_00250 [Christensenellaceae bacterium]|jgi:hypothetical protein|nr:hypothetical protein [Christensenellaceae bacterium]
MKISYSIPESKHKQQVREISFAFDEENLNRLAIYFYLLKEEIRLIETAKR